jgi:hypothetical protein
MIKKARERADEIVRSAELRRRRLEADAAHPHAAAEPEEEAEEYDPVAALARTEPPLAEPEVSDDLEPDLGEASWTSRAASKEAPEPSR